MNIRQFVNERPWMGWAFSGLLVLIGGWVMMVRLGAGSDAYDGKRMQEMVTIKYTDTGETVQMPRGRLIKMLLDQGGTLDATKGIINPATKEPTGFLYSKDEWENLVKQLNDDRAAAAAARGRAPAGK